MMKGKLPILAIIGPTAVGKTKLSLEIAETLKAEVISQDSRQVYRYMNVGTDITFQTRQHILHHMLDVVDPDEVFLLQILWTKAWRRLSES